MAVGLGWCTSKADPEMQIEPIGGIIERTEAANNEGDVQGWVALFEDGAIYMPPGQPAVTTGEELPDVARAGLTSRRSQIRITPDDIRPSGTGGSEPVVGPVWSTRTSKEVMMKLLAMVGLVLLVTPASTRAQAIGVGGYGTYNTVSGDDFEGTDAGFGFAAFVRYMTPSGFGLGAGAQLNTHDVNGVEPNLHVLGIYAEPRYQFSVPNSIMKPVLGARVYWVQQSISQGADDLKASGVALGGIGGLLFQLQPQFALEPAVTWTHLSFGDAELNGTTIPNSETSGSSLGIQISFVVSFPAK